MLRARTCVCTAYLGQLRDLQRNLLDVGRLPLARSGKRGGLGLVAKHIVAGDDEISEVGAAMSHNRAIQINRAPVRHTPIEDGGAEGLEEELGDERGSKVHAEDLQHNDHQMCSKHNENLVVLGAVLGHELDAGRRHGQEVALDVHVMSLLHQRPASLRMIRSAQYALLVYRPAWERLGVMFDDVVTRQRKGRPAPSGAPP